MYIFIHYVEFVGLRPKMYSILSEKGEKKTAKGICRRTVKKNITHSDYRDCLFNRTTTMCTIQKIQSDKHNLYTVRQRKLALNPADNKKYILPDGVATLAYGHYKIGFD